jgi:hypothetical protein
MLVLLAKVHLGQLTSDIFAIDIDIVHEWIVLRRSLVLCELVGIVGDELLRIDIVRELTFNICAKRFIEVELADMMDSALSLVSSHGRSSTPISSPVSNASHDVDMSGAAIVMSWKDHIEKRAAIVICWKSSSLPVGVHTGLAG